MAPRKNDVPESENGSQSGMEVPEGWASVLFDKAFSLAEEYAAVVKARKANRESLRSLATQGLLSAEELEMLEELHPERNIRRRTDEERAADLEEQARAFRERAEKKTAAATA